MVSANDKIVCKCDPMQSLILPIKKNGCHAYLELRLFKREGGNWQVVIRDTLYLSCELRQALRIRELH